MATKGDVLWQLKNRQALFDRFIEALSQYTETR